MLLPLPRTDVTWWAHACLGFSTLLACAAARGVIAKWFQTCSAL